MRGFGRYHETERFVFVSVVQKLEPQIEQSVRLIPLDRPWRRIIVRVVDGLERGVLEFEAPPVVEPALEIRRDGSIHTDVREMPLADVGRLIYTRTRTSQRDCSLNGR